MATPPPVDLAYEQRQILRNAAISAVSCGATLIGACYALALFYEPPQALAQRIAFALQADVFMWVWLAIGAKMVSGGRYRSAADNRGSALSPPSPHIAIKVAFLQNTLEQAVMAAGVHLALASLLTGPSLFFIPAAVALFAVGRITFLRGCPKGAGAHSFGRATKAIPTVVGLPWAIGLVVRNLLG